MRSKALTIIFILSLAIYQYGKIVSYIGCRINEMTSTVTRCDCEKFGKELANTSTAPVPQKTVIKEKPDDFFTNFNNKIIAFAISASSNKIIEPRSVLANGCSDNIFQPPRL